MSFLTFSQRQAPQSSALGALMSFSVKLSDMERQITSFERKIQRQTAEIDQLSAKLDSKAERTQFQNLEILLNSKMVTLKDEINTKDLVIKRYRDKLRQLEAEVMVRELVHKCSINLFRDALCTRVGCDRVWGFLEHIECKF